MITRPDEYKHTNDNYAIVDNDNVRGGVFNIASFDTVNLLLIPADKRKLKTSVNDSLGLKSYSYSGSDLTDANWGLLSLWKELNKHVDGFSSKPATPLSGANVISQVAINTNGHVTGVVTRGLTPTDIEASWEDHTHDKATTTVSGFLSSEDKLKLNGVEDSADANQNAFSNITVNSTTISATLEEDTFTINSGTGIEITPSGKTITISSTGGYTHPTGFTDAPTTALSGANIISKIEVNTNGHVEGIISRQLTPADIGASATNHTHSNLLPSGGTVGQILVKNSSTDYDASFSTPNYTQFPKSLYLVYSSPYLNVPTTNPTTAIYNFLPSSGNLQGEIYKIRFSYNTTYNFTEILSFSKYYNGEIQLIVIPGFGTLPNIVFTLPDNSLGTSNGVIVLPKQSTIFSIINLSISVTCNSASNSFCVLSGINNNAPSVYITGCTFNFDAVSTSPIGNLISCVNSNLITLSDLYVNFTNCTNCYIFGSDIDPNNKLINNWYLINITSSSAFKLYMNSFSTNTTITIVYYSNISSAIPILPTIPLTSHIFHKSLV